MAIVYDRTGEGWSVLLSEQRWLDAAEVAPALAAAMEVARADAIRACARQRGIVVQGLDETRANAAVSALVEAGYLAVAVPDVEVPILPRPLELSVVHFEGEGLRTPSIIGAGIPQFRPWGNLALISAAILADPTKQAAALLDKFRPNMLDDPKDRLSVAQKQRERARDRIYPLTTEIRREEPSPAAVIESAMAKSASRVGKGRKAKGKVEKEGGTTGQTTCIDLIFTGPFERLRITSATRAKDVPQSVHPAKNLHVTLNAMLVRSGRSRLTRASEQLSAGVDSGEYLFDDEGQLSDYLRWCYRTAGPG